MKSPHPVPEIRIRPLNSAEVAKSGEFVLYWMIANRRIHWNFSLQRAAELASQLQKPLVILEALRIHYRWASDRLHRFILQGMEDNLTACEALPVTYHCYVEPELHHGKGLFEALSSRACVVLTDDFPCFFLPAMLKLTARQCPVRMEAVDSNGLLPMQAADHDYPTAHSFRRFLQKTLPKHLETLPAAAPLDGLKIPTLDSLPAEILKHWPAASLSILEASPDVLSRFEIDHQVRPAAFDGGRVAALQTAARFFQTRMNRYAEDRNNPDNPAASGFSPYLHFGHLSAHEIFTQIVKREGWKPEHLQEHAGGSREGWWGMSPGSESFLDELITWRELGYNMCFHRAGYDRYQSLPDWARRTLEKHAADPRPALYSLDEFETSRTHDELWNAAQRQLVREGWMHNYLRMLWGKKILEWTETPQQALEFMIELNNKYAVDGRNPNSYSGIFWVLGRYDRAWGPERPVYGTIRYMSSDNTLRKLKLKSYLRKFS